MFFAALGCGIAGCVQQPLPYSPRVAGRFVSQGGELGDFTLAPDRCYRGSQGDFDLTDARVHAQVVRFTSGGNVLAGRTHGAIPVRVANYAAPGGPREVVFAAASCRVLVGFGHPINLDGALRLDCDTPGGGRFQGFATFAGCPP